MKKVYLLLIAASFTLGVSAQTTKKSKTAKKVKTEKVISEKVSDVKATASVATGHEGHNHNAPAAANDVAAPMAQAQVVEAVKPVGEDNLQILTTHDFGKIPQGKPVTTEFVIKNIGKGELKLDQVQAGCGCTTPTWQPGPYAAGQEAKITVGYNAAAAGSFSKPVTITYNGGLTKVITITGEVVAAPPAPAPDNKAGEILKQGGN